MSQTDRMEEPADTFDFYLKFAKPLVLNLKDPNDRVIASAWVQKLKDVSIGPESVRKDYLKLLLFVLHRKRLIGPFLENPSGYTDLKNFPADFKILDVAKELILSDELERKKRIKSGLASGDYPPYSVECSADLLEYAAAQDIPKFGVHAYYAISLEPIPKWDNTDKGVLPKAAVEVLEKSIRQVSSTSELEKGAQGETSAKSTKKSPFKTMSRGGGTPKLSPKSPKSAEELPSPFQGTPKRPVAESPFGLSPPIDDRPRVTWGSNLIDVTEPAERDDSITSMGIMEDNIDDFLVEGGGSAIFGELPAISSPMDSMRTSSPRATLERSAMYDASLPYQTPPRGGYPPSPAPSLPYRTPPRMDFDMTAGSAPYLTPPRHDFDMTAGSAPYLTPPRRLDFDMTGASLPYLTPPRGPPSPAPSLPYRTPSPRDPRAMAERQYGSLMDSPSEAMDLEIEPLTEDAREIIQEANQSMNMADMDEAAHQSGQPWRKESLSEQQPMEQVFPQVQEADPWSQMFFDAQADDLIDDEEEISLADDMEVTTTPQEDVDERIRNLMLGLADRKSSSPVAGGVATTTPRTSPSPVRSRMYGTDFPLFTEVLPAYESPIRSPMTAVQEAAEAQYASLRDRSPSPRQASPRAPTPPAPRPPSPVRDPYTDSFGLPVVHTHDSPLKQRSPSPPPKARSPPKPPTPPAMQTSPVAGPSTAARSPTTQSPAAGPSPAKSPKSEAEIKEIAESQYKSLMESPKPEKPAPLSHEEVEEYEDSQYATLYESLIAEPEAPALPSGRSPHRMPLPSDLMGVEAPVHHQSPPQPYFFGDDIPGNLPSPLGARPVLAEWQTPPDMRLQQRRVASPVLPPVVAYFGQDLLGQEQFPSEEEPPRSPPPSPPTPPPRFTYEEMADPFQLDEDFNEPVEDIMDEEMTALGGMVAAHEVHPYQENLTQRVQAGRRAMTLSRRKGTPMPRHEPIDEEPEYLMLPSPERASPARTFSEYDYLLSPAQRQQQQQQEQQQQQQQQQSPAQVAGPSMRSQAEELFIEHFDNPDHQAMMRRVMALVEDVEDEALITEGDVQILKEAHPLTAIESTDTGGVMMAVSPPREQQELLELNDMEGPLSPLQQPAEISEFNFQPNVQVHAPYQLPYELPQSRHVFTEPVETQEPEQPFQEILAIQEAQGQPPVQIQDIVVPPSPSPIRRRVPTPGTYVSPPANMAEFFLENINRQPVPYREGPTNIYTGGRQQILHRDASRRVPRMRRIRELPNMDEEGVEFMEHVERAGQWYGKESRQADVLPIDVTGNRERMQQRRASRNVLPSTNLRTVTETQEVSEPLVSPEHRRGQPRIKKRMVRKRINFDQENPSGSPEPQKQVSPIHEPLPLLPDRPLPPPRIPMQPGAPQLPQMSTTPVAGPSSRPPSSQSARRVLFGSPVRPEEDRPRPRRITLFGSPLPEGEEASPTTANTMLTMLRHADLLRQPSPPRNDDIMGAYGPVEEPRARYILDEDDIPEQLPSPMRPPIELPGWSTPPEAARAVSPRLRPMVAPVGVASLMVEQPPLVDDDDNFMSPTQSPMLATQQQSFLPSPARPQAPWPGGTRTVTSTTTVQSPEMTKTTKSTTITPSSHQPQAPPPPPQFYPSPQQQQQPSPQSYQMASPMTPRTPAHVSPRPSPYWSGGTPIQTPPFQMIRQQQAQRAMTPSPASPGAWARPIGDMSTMQADLDVEMLSPHLVESPQQQSPEEEWPDIRAMTREDAQIEAPPYGHLASAEDYVMPEVRRRTPRQGTLLERVEQLVADVPTPVMPIQEQPSPVNTVQYSPYQSPHWTPRLPTQRATAVSDFDGLSPLRPQAAEIGNLEVISPVLAMSPRSPTASPSPRQPSPQSPRGMSPVFATSPQTLGVVPFIGEEIIPYELPGTPQASPPPRAIQEDIHYSPPAYQSPPRSRTPSPRVPSPRVPTPRMPTPAMQQSPHRPPTPRSPPMTMTAASPRRSPVVGNLVAVSPQQQQIEQPYIVETTETVEEYTPEHIMDRYMSNAELMQQPSALTERQLDWQSPPAPARVAPVPTSPYRPELHLPPQRRTLDMMSAAPSDMMFMNENLDDILQSPSSYAGTPQRSPTQGIFDQIGAAGGGTGLFDYDYPELYDPVSPMYQSPQQQQYDQAVGGGSPQYYDLDSGLQHQHINEMSTIQDELMLQERMSPMAGPSHQQPRTVAPGASETTINEEIVYGPSGQPHTITKETTTVLPDGQVQEEYEYTEMMDNRTDEQNQQQDDDGYDYAD